MQSHTCVLLLVLISLALTSCADRERNNPLDPRNPDTGGRPSGLRVSSSADTAFLVWDRLGLSDLVGIQIYRKTEGEADFTPFALASRDAFSFQDTPVAFGLEHEYQISALGDDFESLRSDVVVVEPGPTFNWVADNSNRTLFKLTHDARNVVKATFGFITAIDVEPNAITGEVWVIDFIASVIGQIVKVRPSGDVEETIVDLIGPRDIAVHHETGVIWIADEEDRSVIKVGPNVEVQLRVPGFGRPIAVGVDQRDGSCWVADRGGREVVKLNSGGARVETQAPGFNSLRWLAVNSGDGSVWVADSSRIVELDASGQALLEISPQAGFAYKLAINQNTGDLWVLNWQPSTVTKYNPTGQLLFELTGFARPQDLSVNNFDGSCLVADTENNRVVRISTGGTETKVVREFQFPIALGVQNEP